MDNNKIAFATIDEYISQFPLEVREKLQQIRAVIKEAAPEATEKISYQMPAFYLNGNLVFFAAFKHISVFIPHREALKLFGRSCRNTKERKVRYSSPWINRCRLNW